MAKLTATFGCPKCKAVYQCEYRDFPVRDKGKFHCENCQTLVHSWNGNRDYTDFKMVRQPDRIP